MKRLTLLAVVLGLLFTLPAMAQSAKATAKVSSIISFDGTLSGAGSSSTAWTDILSNNIKTANQKDLFVNASLECGLLTKTRVRSKNGEADTSSASAAVEVRVVLDKGTSNETVFEPKTISDGTGGTTEDDGRVVFCRRTQTLTALFLGLNCTADLLTGEVTCEDPEELELILDTMNANAFNFYLGDVKSGNHTITVQARIALNNTVQTGEVEAQAFLGKGSVTMESVRLVKGDDVVDIP